MVVPYEEVGTCALVYMCAVCVQNVCSLVHLCMCVQLSVCSCLCAVYMFTCACLAILGNRLVEVAFT